MNKLSQTPFATTVIRSPRPLALMVIIALAAASRLLHFFWPHAWPPNFTPMLAIALFAGATFATQWLAYAVPLGAMLLADAIIGFSLLSPLIYALLLAMVWLGHGMLSTRPSALRIAVSAAGSATGFFLISNFAVWLFFSLYPHTPAGLLQAYVAGIPFYLFGTLAGTLFWSAVLFGLFAWCKGRFPRVVLRPVTITRAG